MLRGARGRERRGPTRFHPEPGRDPRQRRRVLTRRRVGRRGRCGRPPPEDPPTPHTPSLDTPRSRIARRGVEQWQLVGLITQRSEVRILPPLPRMTLAGLYESGLLYLTPYSFSGTNISGRIIDQFAVVCC